MYMAPIMSDIPALGGIPEDTHVEVSGGDTTPRDVSGGTEVFICKPRV